MPRPVPLLTAGLLLLSGCVHQFLCRPDHSPATPWTDLGEVPGGAERYPPQGMTLMGDQLVFTNHWNDTKSGVYLVDPDSMTVLEEREMPPEAVHTSGLGWDGETLWAVDYKSLLIYAIDPVASFEGDQVVVTSTWPTGLGGSSALTCFELDGVWWLAVSDFMNSARTYVFPRDAIDGLHQQPLDELATISFPNGTFSQGLTWDGRYLLETVGNRGVDRIEVYDIVEALRQEDSSLVHNLGNFAAPEQAGEDLATDGDRLWTSDEHSYRWYRLDGLQDTVRYLEQQAE